MQKFTWFLTKRYQGDLELVGGVMEDIPNCSTSIHSYFSILCIFVDLFSRNVDKDPELLNHLFGQGQKCSLVLDRMGQGYE